MEKTKISERLDENIAHMEELFHTCDDIKKKRMNLGKNRDVACYLTFIEVSVDMGNSALLEVLKYLRGLEREEILRVLEQNALGTSDATYFTTIEEAGDGLLTGEAIFFVDGFAKAVKIPDDGYPNMGVNEADSEKVVRGSNEGFGDSVKQNAALIRKRIRSPQVKVKEKKAGVRSNTNVYLVYMEGIVYPELVAKIEEQLDGFEIDGVLDSGVIEQLSEEKWYSPFPQFQTTERPDRAAMSILDGRVVVLSDNSPIALILPTDYNSFIKTSDDYYNRWEIASFERLLRYLASFFAMTLPGLYLAVTNFHTQILPTTLLLSFADARSGVPFPAVIEVIIMELSFELLREAGVRRSDGEYDRNCGRTDHRAGSRGGKSGKSDCRDCDLIYGAVLVRRTERGICNGVPAAQVLFYRNLRMARLFRISGRAACGADPSVALKKLWCAVPGAICGGRSE